MTAVLTRKVCLGNLCSLIADHVDPKVSPETLYIGLEHLRPGRITRYSGGRSTDMQSSKTKFRKNDVLYGKLRPYLDKACLADADGVCTTELLVLRPRAGIDPTFLVGILHSAAFIEHAMSGVTGVQHPRTSWQRIREFKLPDFDQREQRAIGYVIEAGHAAITACEATLEIIEALRWTAMRDLFANGSRGQLQKDTEIGPIPETWDVKTIGELVAVKGGKRLPRGISLSDKDTGQLYVRVTDFSEMSVRTRGMMYVPKAVQPLIARYTISADDVYISIAGTIGLVGQVPRELDGANLTENAAKLVAGNRIQPRYLMYALASPVCQEQIGHATAKNAQPKLALTRIEQLRLPVPNSNEQVEIVEMLDAIGDAINLHKRKKGALEELFKALLIGLITRKIGVLDIDLTTLVAAASTMEVGLDAQAAGAG